MAQVTFQPAGRTVEVVNGTTILEAARTAGVTIEAPCNGAGHCGKCLVRLPFDDLAYVVTHFDAPADNGVAGAVLACHSEVHGDVTVEIPARNEEGLRVISAGTVTRTALAPFISRSYDPQTDRTVVRAGEQQLGIEDGDTTGEHVGLVVDIGTTTLVAVLVDLNSGKELAVASSLNPQSLHAQDVLSRIRLAADETGRTLLHRELVTELNRMIQALYRNSGIPAERIYEAVMSGNTCMLHLLANIDPSPLGKHPFVPAITGGVHLRAADVGLQLAPGALLYLPPVISAYVGADISSGILAGNLAKLPGTTLFIDIGTNGELVLAIDGRLIASATAAGPAFEGMNISCGMRAAIGAVERADISPAGILDIGVIGNGDPTGICGSGLMDLVAELVESGLIGKNGRLVPPPAEAANARLAERLIRIDGGSAFHIHEHVVLSQKDIRQVQLAKGAIRAGIELLLTSGGLSADRLDRVVIAGSFGYHLREKSLITMGLLPPSVAGKVSFIGNTSRSGAELLIKNQTLRETLKQQTDTTEIVDLAGNPEFERVFMAMMGF